MQPLDVNLLVQHLSNHPAWRGKSVDQAAAQAALAKVDQQSIIDQENSSLVTEIWDKQSAINGVQASYFLNERHDVDPNTEIYLLKNPTTGQVVIFQPHVPGAAGFVRMSQGDVATHAENHRQGIIQSRATARILDAATQNMLPNA